MISFPTCFDIRDVSLGQGWGFPLDLAWEEPARAIHAQAADFALDDFQPDDPAARILLGDDHRNGLKALVVIGFFQCLARLFDVFWRAGRAKEWIDGLPTSRLFKRLVPMTRYSRT